MTQLSKILALVLAATSMSFAEELYMEPSAPKNDGYLTFYFDNDLFGGDDKDYTNGVRLSWISGDRTVDQLGPLRNLRKLSGDDESFGLFKKITGFKDASKIHYNYGFSLTQLMYTPEDPFSFTQPDRQRRYAGWLGLGLSLHVKDERILNSIEFTVGMIGSNSLAEQSQDFIHSVRDFDKFNGWENQVPNEVTADISFVQKRRADFIEVESGAFRIDGLTEWGVRLGTFRTEAHLGGFFRAGYNLPSDFSDPRLSSTAYSHSYFDGIQAHSGSWSVYTLFGATVRAVGYDATMDGPVFRDFNTGNRREPFVAEVFCGLGVRYRRVELSYVHSWRTEEYREQEGNSDFGSVAIRMKF